MRRLLVWVPEGGADAVRETSGRNGATQALRLAADADSGPVDLFVLHVPNQRVGDLVDDLTGLEGLHVSMLPQGVLALEPPSTEAPQQVLDVTLRSPLEIFLSALQSIGSWRGFLAYAGIAGAVVWVGLLTNTVYLLTAAMLIAPFAGPAMNAAVATARGDAVLLRRSIARYFAALGVAGVTAAVLTVVFRQQVVTNQMIEVSTISTAAVVLPLAAGAAGAINLSQSQRTSLVSGAATGMLVAAALAPPVGVVGMAAVLREWDIVRSGLFLLGLQLVGINLSGAAVFRVVGLGPVGVRLARGTAGISRAAAAASLLVLAAFLAWQFSDAPDLQRSTISQRAAGVVQEVVRAEAEADLVEANARFTRSDIEGQDTLLITAYVQSSVSPDGRPDLARRLTQAVQSVLRQRIPHATPLVEVTVLAPPE